MLLIILLVSTLAATSFGAEPQYSCMLDPRFPMNTWADIKGNVGEPGLLANVTHEEVQRGNFRDVLCQFNGYCRPAKPDDDNETLEQKWAEVNAGSMHATIAICKGIAALLDAKGKALKEGDPTNAQILAANSNCASLVNVCAGQQKYYWPLKVGKIPPTPADHLPKFRIQGHWCYAQPNRDPNIKTSESPFRYTFAANKGNTGKEIKDAPETPGLLAPVSGNDFKTVNGKNVLQRGIVCEYTGVCGPEDPANKPEDLTIDDLGNRILTKGFQLGATLCAGTVDLGNAQLGKSPEPSELNPVCPEDVDCHDEVYFTPLPIPPTAAETSPTGMMK
jgi:hypothetical protein